MLRNLYIKNYVIIEKINIDFTSGLNVITGETGAGKSILIDALDILTGSRLDKKSVGIFGDESIVEGSFSINNKETRDFLEEKGYPLEEDLIIVSRQWSREGPSSSRLNGRIVTASMIKEIMVRIIDIHGQNQNQTLLRKDNYFRLLDDYSKEFSYPVLSDLKKCIDELKFYEKELSSIDYNEKEVDRELDILQFQLKEIDEIDLENIDENEIEEEYDRLSKIESIQEKVQVIYEKLSGYDEKGNLLDRLNEITHEISEIANFDKTLQEISDQSTEGRILFEDLTTNLYRFKDGLYYDEEKYYYLERNIEIITKLKRKYGNNIKDILKFKDRLILRQELLSNIEENRRILIHKMDVKREEAYNYAEELNKIRNKSAQIIEQKMTQNLIDLNMNNASFRIKIDKESHLNYNGFDSIDFLIQTNKGQDYYSLSKIASGGEISRIMLGFKQVFAEVDPVGTLIFDEIDAGISGRTAQIVGEKLVDLSSGFQIISISHLPQIASLADHHLLIKKDDIGNKTISNLFIVEGNERSEEIARLIGGVDITETTRLQAKEMLEQAISKKKERRL